MNRLAQLLRERLNPDLMGLWSRQSFGPLMMENHASAIAGLAVKDTSSKDQASGLVVTTMPRTTLTPSRLSPDQPTVRTSVRDIVLLPLHEQIREFGRRLSSAGIEQLRLVPLFLLRGKHVMEDIP